jgi:hypothetical protein
MLPSGFLSAAMMACGDRVRSGRDLFVDWRFGKAEEEFQGYVELHVANVEQKEAKIEPPVRCCGAC